jgi:Fe-S cluster assembly protein SufD
MSESALQPFSEQYDALTHARLLPGADVDWLTALRERGIRRFRELGFPTQRVESWKYTSLRNLERNVFHPSTIHTGGVSIDTVPSLIGEQAGHRAVFVNGWFRPELSKLGRLPEGASLHSLQQDLELAPQELGRHMDKIATGHDNQPFYHLNSALMQDGVVLRVTAGVTVRDPIEVVHIAAPTDEVIAYHPRHLVVLEDGSEATLVEHHVGMAEGTSFANHVTEIRVSDNAKLHHYKLHAEPESTFHVHTLHATVGENGFYDGFGLTIGGKLTRNELHVRLDGAHADARLNGAYLQHGRQHCDNTTLIEHVVPDTRCREIFKGALEGKGRAVFQGKLHVHPDAQRTDGNQLSRALLLSPEAEIDAKPELEIYADDVVCSHGSTAGDLEQDALFYLRSRGIPYATARRIMVESFLDEVVEEMTLEHLRTAFMQRISDWLDRSQATA